MPWQNFLFSVWHSSVMVYYLVVEVRTARAPAAIKLVFRGSHYFSVAGRIAHTQTQSVPAVSKEKRAAVPLILKPIPGLVPWCGWWRSSRSGHAPSKVRCRPAWASPSSPRSSRIPHAASPGSSRSCSPWLGDLRRAPEGILEYQKSRWMHRVNRLLSAYDQRRGRRGLPWAIWPPPPTPALWRSCRQRRSAERCSVVERRCAPRRGRRCRRPGGAPLLLDARGVSIRFGGVAALKEVSMSMVPGEAVGLVGPNGAGKTTLFNCLCGQLRPAAGTVSFDGEVHRRPARPRPGPARDQADLPAGGGVPRDVGARPHDRGRAGPGAVTGRCGRTCSTRASPDRDELDHVEEVLAAGRADGPGRRAGGRAQPGSLPPGGAGPGPRRRAPAAHGRRAVVGTRHRRDRRAGGVLRTRPARAGHGRVARGARHGHGGASAVDRVVVLDVGEIIAQGPFDAVVADPEVRRAYLGRSA